ncbi:MAG: phosphoribosyl-AMP cyclohydrolase [Nitrosomonas sp.]|nr:phosphoribosyl-AMP cyclohydrolase [Nitrosomonas sp.]MCW5606474.1 phosphoribosyl-AMP cyclohydrolase [Nitrosomonas sp.]
MKEPVKAVPHVVFYPRESIEQVEEGYQLAPKFDDQGLIVCVTQDASSGVILMVGYMNAEALIRTIETGEAHYWSRSRQILWHKGATSGFVQHVEDLFIDDDQDAIWLRVSVSGSGASCHVGYRSCFYRKMPITNNHLNNQRLVYTEAEKTFDPKRIYGDTLNPTQL